MKAFQDGTLPFPNGTILAKVTWKRVSPVEGIIALGKFQALVPWRATTMQIMEEPWQPRGTTRAFKSMLQIVTKSMDADGAGRAIQVAEPEIL